jgi:O-antigen ligase
MTGLILTAAIWITAILATRSGTWARPIQRLNRGLIREHTVLVLLLLAYHSRALRAGAEDSLSNPFTIETVTRGVLALGALALLVPLFMPQARLAHVVRGKRYGMLALGFYFIVAALSTLWSASTFNTAGKALELGVAFGLVWVLVMRNDAVDALKNTIKFVLFLETALIVVAMLGFVFVPSVFSEELTRRGFFVRGTMVAPFGGPNGFSAVGAMLGSFAMSQYFEAKRGQRRGHWMALVFIGSVATVLSSGRQGVLIWLVGISVVLLIYRRELFILVLAPAGVIFVIFSWDLLWGIVSRDQVSGSLATLTGRTTLWAAGWDAFMAQPVTGYGFGAGSRFVALRAIGKDYLTHIHNGFLEALIGVGLVGFIPFIYAVQRTLKWSVRHLIRRIEVPFAILVLPLTMQNLFGLGFGAWFNTNLMLFALLVGLADAMGVKPPGKRSGVARPLPSYAR